MLTKIYFKLMQLWSTCYLWFFMKLLIRNKQKSEASLEWNGSCLNDINSYKHCKHPSKTKLVSTSHWYYKGYGKLYKISTCTNMIMPYAYCITWRDKFSGNTRQKNSLIRHQNLNITMEEASTTATQRSLHWPIHTAILFHISNGISGLWLNRSLMSKYFEATNPL